MSRLISLTAAIVATVATVPAVAQSGYYSARPTVKFKKTSLVTRNTLWRCADGICSANKATERDGILCELVVQRVGTLESFTANGTAFSDDALTKCNARAR